MKFHWHKIVIVAAFGLFGILLVLSSKPSDAMGKSGSSESMARHASDAAPVQTAEEARAANEVIIGDFEFMPGSLTVPVGTTVTWSNHDGEAHTVNSATDVFKSAPLDTDEKFSFKFTAPGIYPYYCRLHPQMKGQIVVQ